MELAQLSKVVDDYQLMRQQRLAADKEAKRLKANETKLKESIIHTLLANDVGMVGGTSHKVTLRCKTKFAVSSWEDYYDYIDSHKAFHLLQRRVADGAVQEVLEESGEEIPGIEPYEVNDLSIAKL